MAKRRPHPLRIWRALNGMSQAALAKKAKVSQGYICRIENRDCPGITMAVAGRIAAATRGAVSVKEIVG